MKSIPTAPRSIYRPVMILNKSWLPVHVVGLEKAIKKVCSERAKFLDTSDYSLYNWESWIAKFWKKNEHVFESEQENWIKAKHISVLAPEIAVCRFYNKVPKYEIRLSRRNLLIRDGFTCQYTGKKLNAREATVDHILPRSRGGKTTWNNLVIACKEINVKKGDKTPSEAGYTLLKQPVRPKWNPIYSILRSRKNLPESWKKFLNV